MSAEIRTTSSTGGQKGVKLERFDLIPTMPLVELARHFGRGARKYDLHQWRQGYEWSKSYSALQRHLTAWWSGEEYDVCPEGDDSGCVHQRDGVDFSPEEGVSGRTCWNHTGSHHLVCAAWHTFVLQEFVAFHPEHDDRFETSLNRKARH
jgi:hypothetical protein